MQLYQFRVSARRRLEVFAGQDTRRRVILGLARLTGPALVSFSLAPEHGHVVAYSTPSQVGLLRRAMRLRLAHIVAEPLEPVWHEPVHSEAHAWALLKYSAAQAPHHDLPAHPALFDGSYVQDMVGARAVPGLQLRVAEAAPGFRLRQLHEWVGLPPVPVRPVGDDAIHGMGIQRLRAAAASAVAAAPELRGRRAAEVRAKRIVAQLARAAGIRPADVKWALGLTQRGVEDLRARPADPAAIRATRVRLSLERTVFTEVQRTNGRP